MRQRKESIVHSGRGDDAQPTALAVVSPAPLVPATSPRGDVPAPVQTEGDLDAAVADVQRLKGEMAHVGWRLGRRLVDIHSRQLWKLRPAEDGRPQAHRSFEMFCERELGISRNHAGSLMAVAERYSEEQAQRLGTSKLAIVLTLPPGEEQVKALNMAEAGAGKRELAAHATQVKREMRYQKPSRGRTVPHNAGKPRAPMLREPAPPPPRADNGEMDVFLEIPKTGGWTIELQRNRAGVGVGSSCNIETTNGVRLCAEVVRLAPGSSKFALRLTAEREK